MTDKIDSVCRALWITGPNECELREAALPSGGSQVLVRSMFSAISRGTESLVLSGAVPPEVALNMRAPHQDGEFPWPVKYGYCNVGRVETRDVELTGRAVFSLRPHQDFFLADPQTLCVLPEGLPAERAVLAANMETALNAVWDANLKAGDRVAVVGAGVVGALIAYLAAGYPGTEVELVDINGERANVAEALGVSFRAPQEASGSQDVVFHVSGHSDGLATALSVAGQESQVVELSWYGNRSVSAPLGLGFHHKRLQLRSSQVGQLPPSQRARWSYRRRLQKALLLCQAPELDCLFSSDTSFAELAKCYPALIANGGLCHRVRY